MIESLYFTENKVLYFSSAGQLFQAKSSDCTDIGCDILQMNTISNETNVMASINNTVDFIINPNPGCWDLKENCCQFITFWRHKQKKINTQ